MSRVDAKFDQMFEISVKSRKIHDQYDAEIQNNVAEKRGSALSDNTKAREHPESEEQE